MGAIDTTIIDQLGEKHEGLLEQITALATREDQSDEDRATVAQLEKRAGDILKQRETLINAQRARANSLDLSAAMDRASRLVERKMDDHAAAGDSPGDVFTRSRAFTEYDYHGRSAAVDLQIRAATLPMKTTDFPTAILAGSSYLPSARILTPLLDLIPTRLTNNSDYALWGTTVATDAGGAAVVPEGDAKPPMEISEAKLTGSLDLVAVYTQATRQLLEDVYGMRDFIDQELVRAVLKKFEELAVTAVTGASIPTATAPNTGGTMAQAIRLGVAKVQSAGWYPNAVAVNPDDSAGIDVDMLDKAGACCTNGYWGLQVVPVPGLTAGTAIVGDFANGAVTIQRQQGVSVFMTDSHADTFIHNVFTILAETRRKTVIQRADAFAKVSVASS